MKTLLTLAIAFAISPVFGQAFFDFGVKGAYGPTYMLNQNLADDTAYDHELNSGYAVGAKLGVHFAGHHGFTFDYMRAKSNQNFGLTNKQIHEYSWTHNDLLLMYRFSGNGAYVEFGPKLSLVSDVTSLNSSTTNVEMDVSEFFEDSYTSLVFGFGSYLAGSDVLTLQAGVRIHYALTDMINDAGIEAGYPATSSNFDYNTDYQKTRATAGQFSLELNYAFGRFAKASCSQRWRLILFE